MRLPKAPSVLQAEALQSTPCVSIKIRSWWTFPISAWILFLVWSLCSQAQRVHARKQQGKATKGPAGKDLRIILTYHETWISLLCDMRILVSFSTAGVKEPVSMKWTPQRVPNTRNQPMSAMVCRIRVSMSADWSFRFVSIFKVTSRCSFQKWHLSKQPSPFCITPGLQSCKTKLKLHQEVRRNHSAPLWHARGANRKHWSSFDTFRRTER